MPTPTRTRLTLLVSLGLFACAEEKDPTQITVTDTVTNTVTVTDVTTVEVPLTDTITDLSDVDGDGATIADDCDDDDATRFPGATETCDGIDNNCDGATDEGLSTDGDGDGHYLAGGCMVGDDCDDANADIYPGAAEYCGGADMDCDAATMVTSGIAHFDGVTWTDKTGAGTQASPDVVTLDTAGTAYFCGGTTFSQIVVAADVDLVAAPGTGRPLIHSGWTATNLVIDGPYTVSIDGFDISGGVASQDAPFDLIDRPAGGGIFCRGATVTVNDSTFTDNWADIGGGIYSDACALTVTNSTFEDNIADYAGGGIVSHMGVATVSDTTFSNNETGYAGGGFTQFGLGATSLTNVDFTDNVAARGGGAAFWDNFDGSTLNDATFASNVASGDAGGLLVLSSTVAVNDSRFTGHTTGIGGAVCILPTTSSGYVFSDVTFNRTTMDSNTALYGAGAVYAVLATTRFDSAVMTNNYAGGWGGALALYTLTNNTIVNSQLTDNTGQIGGGAIDIAFGTTTQITNSTIAGNRAIEGDGDGIENYNSYYYGYIGTTTVTNTVMYDNTEEGGTGLDVLDYDATAFVGTSCTEQDLSAMSPGGNVQIMADPRIWAASGELFLDPTSGCADLGDDTAADDAGFAWDTMTTDLDAAIDRTPVDAGFHQDPGAVWIKTFTFTGAELEWTTNAAAGCELTDGVSVIAVGANDFYPAPLAGDWTLTCDGVSTATTSVGVP